MMIIDKNLKFVFVQNFHNNYYNILQYLFIYKYCIIVHIPPCTNLNVFVLRLQVFRLLRSLRPLRVINRAPGLKLVVQTLLSSLRPIGNIVLICCTFFIIFGILGVQVSVGVNFSAQYKIFFELWIYIQITDGLTRKIS